MGDELHTELSAGVLTLTLDRPSRANALGASLVEALIRALDERPADARMIVIRGNGAHFCAGFDLGGLEAETDAGLLLRFVRIESLLQRIFHAPVPVMALAQGSALGAGADLVAACTIRIAAPNAVLRMPGWQFGLALGTRRLASRIGADAARDMLLAGREIGAEQACRIGLVQEVRPEAHWPEAVAEWREAVERLASRAVSDLLALTATDTRAADMAALVETASRPGLKQRVVDYRSRSRQGRTRERA